MVEEKQRVQPAYKGRLPNHQPQQKPHGCSSRATWKQTKAQRMARGFNGRHKANTIQRLQKMEDKMRAKIGATRCSIIDEELATIIPDTCFSRCRNTLYSMKLEL
jgi:hypothetical protein